MDPGLRDSLPKQLRPRQDSENQADHADPDSLPERGAQRRRTQVRLAQRAYRARNEANIAALKSRIAKLESALEQMGQTIVSFSDILIESQILASHPPIAESLRETVKTCLDLAKYGEECQEDIHDTQSPEHCLEVQDSINNQTLPDNHSARSGPEPILMANNINRVFPFGLDGVTMIEVPEFVEHVRIACLYQGFLMLNNPSVPLEALKRPFRLLLPLVPRERITSFFYARLHARLNNERPIDFDEIPFFQLGGAGSHYPELLTSDQDKMGPERAGKAPAIQGALPTFSPEAHEELNGEWRPVANSDSECGTFYSSSSQ
ncbi:AT DNA binding protein, putative [Paecilomyces variotii No. 5]|uniref:AT DNA binding protein, putative n=1 Tax=Byssochlamys spectabilis (strain No. 5 / NBRC 109023) TaxID=1356009 RepID=V5HXV8_BYSSN|nr:AT DNA binding protein, putative [Paecilomyces variotii No. 5]